MGMFLLMLFYAYAGVILFGSVKYGYNLGRSGLHHLNELHHIKLLAYLLA